jgi:hypothetical protein
VIDRREILELAREFALSANTIEKNSVLGWLLAGIFNGPHLSPVHETFQGQTVWAGEVEVFDLVGHPKAKRCYAWAHK